MLSSEAVRVLQAQVEDMGAMSPAIMDVKAIMLSFADRIMDPLVQEVPLRVQSTGCQDFSSQYYAKLSFDDSCLLQLHRGIPC